jgi:hypothetical protein
MRAESIFCSNSSLPVKLFLFNLRRSAEFCYDLGCTSLLLLCRRRRVYVCSSHKQCWALNFLESANRHCGIQVLYPENFLFASLYNNLVHCQRTSLFCCHLLLFEIRLNKLLDKCEKPSNESFYKPCTNFCHKFDGLLRWVKANLVLFVVLKTFSGGTTHY